MTGALFNHTARVAIVLGLARSMVIVRDVVLASSLGTGALIDAFFLVLAVVLWPVTIVQSLLTNVFIPQLVRFRMEGRGAAPRLLLATLVGSGMSALLCAGFWFLIPNTFLFPRLSAEVSLVVSQLIPIFAALSVLAMLNAVLGACAVAFESPRGTLAEGIPPLLVTLLVLIGDPASALHLVGGLALGICIQGVFLWATLRALPEFEGGWSWSFHQELRSLLSGMRALVLPQCLTSSVVLIDQLFAAYEPAGALAHLGYSSRVVAGIHVIAITLLQRSLLPHLSQLAVDEPRRVFDFVSRFGWRLFLGSVLGSAALWCGSSLVVDVLFHRGAFTSSDAEQVAILLQISLLQTPLYLLAAIFVAGCASLQALSIFRIVAFVQFFSKIVLAGLLVPAYGVLGIVLSTVGMQLAGTVAFIIAWRRLQR